MVEPSDSEFAQLRRPIGLARGLLFVGVVWSIAGAFLILHFGQVELSHRLIQAGWIQPELWMPRIRAASCTSQGADILPDAAVKLSDPAEIRQVRYASWRLGHDLGRAAGYLSIGIETGKIPPFMREAENLALALRVPTPAVPTIQHSYSVLDEFEVYLESDPQCVAARLTSRYGPSYGYLYKFGALIGHATPWRAQTRGAVFEPQIQFYGKVAGIPRELWLPMTQDMSPGQPRADAHEQVLADVRRLDSYMKTGQ